MTKQYMKFNEFKTLLFEAMEDDKSAWMGGIFWEVITTSSKNSLLLYYAVLKNEETPIESSIKGLLDKACLRICEEARVPGSIRFDEVTEDFKHKDEYKLFKNSTDFVSENADTDDLKRKIRRTLSSFLMEQKIFVGFEMTEKILGLSSPIKTAEDGVKGAIASVKKMAENTDSFGGWASVKNNLKKMANMPAKDFFIEYGDNFLGALAFKAIASVVKGIQKLKSKEKPTDSSASSGTETSSTSDEPKWTENPIASIAITRGENKTIELNKFIVSNKENAKFEIVSGDAHIDDKTNNMTVNSGNEVGKPFVVKVNLKNSKTNAKIGEKDFNFEIIESKKRV